MSPAKETVFERNWIILYIVINRYIFYVYVSMHSVIRFREAVCSFHHTEGGCRTKKVKTPDLVPS